MILSYNQIVKSNHRGRIIMHLRDKSIITKQKRQSLELADSYERWAREEGNSTILHRALRVRQCSTYWQGLYCPDCGHLSHMFTYGCGDRLCPICSSRKSRAIAAQAMQVVNYLEGTPVLLTLTVKNVPGIKLRKTIDEMIAGWNLIYKKRFLKRHMLSWARTLEITYNDERKDYHPHIHVIMFIDDAELIFRCFWRDLWRDTMNLNYEPQVDIRPITDREGAVYEVSKYVTKTAKVFGLKGNEMDRVIRTLTEVIFKRRLRAYGGQWAKVRSELRQKSVETLDDGQIDALAAGLEKDCCKKNLVPVVLQWSGLEYEMAIDGQAVKGAERGTAACP